MSQSTRCAGRFADKYAQAISGVLSGFDRMILRGTIRRLTCPKGMLGYLLHKRVPLKRFAIHVSRTSQSIRQAAQSGLAREGCPMRYLPGAYEGKESLARQIAQERQVSEGFKQGPICLLSTVETCNSFDVRSHSQTHQLEVVPRLRKCLHLYLYAIHPVFGFMNVRLQTWFPFSVQVCLNGREWLARQMDAEGLAYERHDNCFAWVQDFARAQALLDAQLHTDLPPLLNEIILMLNPLHPHIFEGFHGGSYYWTTHQTEWATDVAFQDPAVLQRVYPLMVRHALATLHSPDVMRFLGRRAGACVPSSFVGEVISDVKTRQEGLRIKHRVDANSVKAYDKVYGQLGSVLRAETTINSVASFWVKRPKEGAADPTPVRQGLRKGVADIHHRARICQRANERYLDALASVDEERTLQELVAPISVPVIHQGRRHRALNPFAATDLALLQAVSHGEFALRGLRNKDLQPLLYDEAPADQREARRRSARVSRLLRLLRAHGLLSKVAHEHRYHVTRTGRTLITAILTARQTPINRLAA